jgi:hypothetical protein
MQQLKEEVEKQGKMLFDGAGDGIDYLRKTKYKIND